MHILQHAIFPDQMSSCARAPIRTGRTLEDPNLLKCEILLHFSLPKGHNFDLSRVQRFPGFRCPKRKISRKFTPQTVRKKQKNSAGSLCWGWLITSLNKESGLFRLGEKNTVWRTNWNENRRNRFSRNQKRKSEPLP